MLDNLGKGSYGEVNKYVHIASGTVVAIKKYTFNVSLSS